MNGLLISKSAHVSKVAYGQDYVQITGIWRSKSIAGTKIRAIAVCV